MIIETVEFQCYYCRGLLNDRNRTRDHIWPKSKGGKLSKENKVFACRVCNRNKADLTLDEWLEKLRGIKRTKRTEKIWIRREFIIPTLVFMIKQLKIMSNEDTNSKA